MIRGKVIGNKVRETMGTLSYRAVGILVYRAVGTIVGT